MKLDRVSIINPIKLRMNSMKQKIIHNQYEEEQLNIILNKIQELEWVIDLLENRFNGQKIYLRQCSRCKTNYSTLRKRSKICLDCHKNRCRYTIELEAYTGQKWEKKKKES